MTTLASDYTACATALAERLHVGGAIHSRQVFDAFRAVPRHLTVPRYYRRAVHPVVLDVADPGPRAADHIYADRSLLTHHPDHDGAQSRASRPGHIAHLLEAAALPAARRVLHVGAGVGYTTALAAHVAERARVVAVETSHRVAADGADAIDRLSLGRRVHYYRGEGYAGCAPEAGYDRVLVTTGVTGISPIWLDQLTDRGFIVAPVYAGGLFPLLAVGRGPAGTGLVGRPVLGAAEFEPATGLLWNEHALRTPPMTSLPPAEHTLHVPALAGITEDEYIGLWLFLAVTDGRVTGARTVSLDAEERDRAVLMGERGAAAIAPDVIASVGPDGQDLAREAERLVEGWLAAGRPRAADWEVRLRLNTATGAPLYTPYRWVLTGRRR